MNMFAVKTLSRTLRRLFLMAGLGIPLCPLLPPALAQDLSTVNAQKRFLEEQNLVAQQVYDPELEKTALEKLSLLLGTDSRYYRLLEIQSRARQGKQGQHAAKRLADSLCHDDGNGIFCQEARDYLRMNDENMVVRLNAFKMYETRDDYENAVSSLEDALGGPPREANLRFRYYAMMGHIPGREEEASRGLAALLRDFPENALFGERIPPLIRSLKAQGLANAGLAEINRGNDAAGQKLLSEALKSDPENPDAPYWQKRLRNSQGWVLVTAGDQALQKNNLRLARERYLAAARELPDSPYPHVGLARAALAAGKTAEFNRHEKEALRLSKNESPEEQRRIRKTLQGVQGDLFLKKAEEAENAGRVSAAIKERLAALRLDPENVWNRYHAAVLLYDSGRIKEARDLFAAAGKLLERQSHAYPYALFLVKTGEEEKALNIAARWEKKDRDLRDLRKKLLQKAELERLSREAQDLEGQGAYTRAAAIREEIRKRDPGDVWNLGSLGRDYHKTGRKDLALRLFSALPEEKRRTPAAVKAECYMLLSLDEEDKALALFTAAEKEGFQDEELRRNILLALSRKAYRNHNPAEAELYLASLPEDLAEPLRARDALSRGDYEAANRSYRKLLEAADSDGNAVSPEILIPAGQSALRAGDPARAALLADRARKALPTEDTAALQELAGLYRDLGEPDRARETLDLALRSAPDSAAPEDRALMLRDYGDLLKDSGSRREAGDFYRKALETLDGRDYSGDLAYTRALSGPLSSESPGKDPEPEPWLRASLRSRGEESFRYLTPDLTLGFRFLRDTGTPGYSDLREQNYLLNFRAGALGGTLELQAEGIHMDAGGLRTGIPWEAMYGSCFAAGCPAGNLGSFTAPVFGARYTSENLAAFLGTAPRIVRDTSRGRWQNTDLLGSIRVSHSFYDGFRGGLRGYRRALTGSLLSYHGDYDPGTGIAWGAVRALGAELSGSFTGLPRDGFWGQARWESVTGKNVADNSDCRIMAGWYHRFINDANERLSLGASLSWLSFDKDLSGYTLGQGGYYSPRSSLGNSLTMTWDKRTQDWSFRAEAGVSLSFVRDGGTPRYPQKGITPSGITDRDAVSSRDSDESPGWVIRGRLERRLGDRLTLGAALGAEKAPDYSPWEGSLYLRYTFGDTALPLPLGPEAPAPVMEW